MTTLGRDREIREIVTYLRAAQVGKVFLGESDGEISPVFPEMVEEWPRRQIRSERERIRSYLRGEVRRFCQQNFPNLKPLKIADLYEPLFRLGVLRMPLTEFREFVGGIRGDMFRGAPLHSTVSISACWGLQTEFPEQHLIKDLAVAFNDLMSLDEKKEEYRNLSCRQMKKASTLSDIADASRRAATYRRMCVLACFNLIEAYINGLAWEYAQEHDVEQLSNSKKRMISEAEGSLIKRLINIPNIIADRPSPLDESHPPLKDFIDSIKPYRDSIVHASPFTAPQKFGGYEKLAKLYDLDTETVKEAVEVTASLIGVIHKHIGGKGDLPPWFVHRKEDGTFALEIEA